MIYVGLYLWDTNISFMAQMYILFLAHVNGHEKEVIQWMWLPHVNISFVYFKYQILCLKG